jgi:hypothetical protein
MVPVSRDIEKEHNMLYLGWVMACVLVALLLPLSGIVLTKMYDTQIKQTLRQIEKLKQEIEQRKANETTR